MSEARLEAFTNGVIAIVRSVCLRFRWADMTKAFGTIWRGALWRRCQISNLYNENFLNVITLLHPDCKCFVQLQIAFMNKI